jgi:hypothetical protein
MMEQLMLFLLMAPHLDPQVHHPQQIRAQDRVGTPPSCPEQMSSQHGDQDVQQCCPRCAVANRGEAALLPPTALEKDQRRVAIPE